MPALSDKDQKRLSGYGFPREVEAAVAEVWSQRFSFGRTGEFVSFCVIFLAAAPLFLKSALLASAYSGLVWGICIAFVLLGAMMFSLMLGRSPNDVDSMEHRKLFLSRNVLSHTFAKGWRKRLGSTAAGLMTLSLFLTGNIFQAFVFAFSSLILTVGTSAMEVMTKSFLQRLEKSLCFAEVWESRSREPFKGVTIEGECVRIA